MQKELRTVVISALISALVVFFAVKGIWPQHSAENVRPANETALERVVRTNHLRCAYISWSASYFMKDPNTGEFKGMGYDLADALAKTMNIKIDWVEEVGVGTMYEGLKTGRYDAICTPVIADATGGPHAAFTRTPYYVPMYAYARADDARFDINDPHVLDKINSENVTVVDLEGSNVAEIHKNRYPKSKLLLMPGSTGGADVMMQVMTKKADITQQNPAYVEDSLKSNPNSLKQVTGALMVFPLSIVTVGRDETGLRDWLSLGIESMLQMGTVDRILDQYDPQKNKFFRAHRGFSTP
ncbi:MAG: transporter substrate-binding domain-containing protein [Alphaproteobacteria bacterium]|nr:transporter substrate-binding domain-containing protein [Alphaproteobacteria bacterium]